MKRLLLIGLTLILLVPLTLLLWLSMTQSGLNWAYQQAGPYLPAGLQINSLQGRLIGPVTLKGIEYAQDGTLIKADQLVVDWHPRALLLANINISRVQLQALSIALPAAAKSDQPVTLPEIHLPWRLLLQDVELNDISFSQGEQRFTLKQVRLDASTLFSRIDISSLRILGDSFSLTIKGNLNPTRNYRHDLAISWQAELPSSKLLKGRGQLTGNMQSSRLKQRLQAPLELTLDAEANNLLGQLNWQAKIRLSRFDASQLDASWPALHGTLSLDAKGDANTATLAGKLHGDYAETGPFDAVFRLQRAGDTSIQIEELKLHAPLSDTRLNAQGQWLPGDKGGEIKLALDWQQLRWPLQGNAWFNSASGNGTVAGTIDHYQLTLNSDSPWPELLPSTWSASAEGNAAGLNFSALRVRALKGEAVASGQFNWSPQLNWTVAISADDIDPAGLLPQWPGQLQAKLSSSGKIDKGMLSASADIRQLTGTLRGYPVSLRSQLRWQDNGLDLDLFELHSGKSTVSARGRLGDKLKLDWAIAASNLAELYPGASGELNAEGLLSGPRETPALATSFNGKALSLPGYAIGSIDGALALDRLDWQQIDIRLAATALTFKDYTLESLHVDADRHHLKAIIGAKEASAHIELKGKLDTGNWHGRIERADILSQHYANWKLRAPVKLTINDHSLSTETLCWHNNQQASVCASLQREAERWQSQLKLDKLPLALLGPWLPAELTLDGLLNADAKLSFQAPGQLLGHARIELPPGSLSYPLLEGERDQWAYRSGKAVITLDAQGLKASTEIAMGTSDHIRSQLTLPGAKLLALVAETQPLQASVELTMHDLGLIEALLPEVYDLRGELGLNLNIDGTLASPRLNLRSQLSNAALRIPRLGLSIEPLSLKVASDGVEKLKFQLNANSGKGKLSVQGQTELNINAGWPTEISIRGDEFEISRIPEARVVVTPDLQIKLKNRTLDISGKVHIPYAELQPKDITTAARVSNDAVIVGAEQAAIERWLINTRIRLSLGERVNFYGFGFEGRLGGSLLLQDEPGQLTRGTGEINIPEGRYRAYGQRLDVEHGRLLYTGGPLSNPGLDIRAVRHVNNVTAGLKVRGSLDQPQLELFSIPAMGQTDALSYLLLGRPIETSSGEEGAMMAKATLALGLSGGDHIARLLGSRFGLDEMRVESSDTGEQASLVMGRYLSPKLYISYGVGLVEAFNTLTVRYQISDKWQLKAESGEAQGADILYTIER